MFVYHCCVSLSGLKIVYDITSVPIETQAVVQLAKLLAVAKVINHFMTSVNNS